MAGIAATCSSMLECSGFGSIDSQRCRNLKPMASLNILSMRTGVLVGSGTGAEALIQKGRKTSVSISTARATATYAAKQEINQVQKIEGAFDKLSTEAGEASTNVVKDETHSGFGHLWTQCNSCYGLNYKKHLSAKLFICEHCGEYLKMSSSDRVDFLIESNTWTPRDEDMIFVDTYGFESQPKSATQ